MTTNLPAKIIEKSLKESIAVDFALMQASSEDAPVYNVRDICAMWDITLEQFDELKRDPEFIRLARIEMMELKRTGAHLASKSKMLLEGWLDMLAPKWLNDDSSSLSDRAKIVDTIIKVAQIIRKDSGETGISGPTAPTVTINLSAPQNFAVEKVVTST